MRIKIAARALLGACAVYGMVSACSGSGVDGVARAGSGAGGATATSGAGVGGGAPVLEVVVEKCDKSWTVGSDAVAYAEHFYPQATAEELIASVAAAGHFASAPGFYQPPGYAFSHRSEDHQDMYFADGKVAFACGAAVAPSFDTVTFVRR